MKRREPPSLPTWMLEHLTPGDRDEALAGDLLEEFRRGRSYRWYRRQVLAACAVAWLRSLRAHIPLLVFAILWSMLAPAWKVLSDRMQDSPVLDRLAQMTGGFWLLPAFAIWTAFHSIFLWVGMLIFILAYMNFGIALRGERVRSAFLWAPIIFLPIIGITFVLMNLYSFPGLVNERLATTLLGQIADLRMPADVLRVPYFIALLCAMWGAIPCSARAPQPLLVQSTPIEPSSLTEPLEVASTLDPFTLQRFLGLMVGAGLMNAMIAGFLLCRLPESHAPSFASLLIRAGTYVAVGALSGVAGTWLYWKNPSSPFRKNAPLPFSLFGIVCAAGWVWVPSMVILSEQFSAAASLVAMIGSFVLASGLRRATHFVMVPAQLRPSIPEMGDVELFVESLYRAPIEIHGYVIAICLYAAAAALLTGSYYTAAALLAISAFLFGWKRTVPRSQSFEPEREYKQAALWLARVAIPAVLVTLWALLDGVAHRNNSDAAGAAFAGGTDSSKRVVNVPNPALSADGYESIVLWPLPEKKQIIPPLPPPSTLLAPGTSQPLIIRFDGPYLYFQPGRRPGTTAHQAQGSPLAVHIQSTNAIPLTIEAHQSLGTAIRLARCREIQVAIANRDNAPGAVALAILLTDSTAPGKPTLYLGQQPLETTQPDRFLIKSAPAYESLRFAVPAHASIRKFDEITVMLLPDIEHALVGPRIAIQQFQLYPR